MIETIALMLAAISAVAYMLFHAGGTVPSVGYALGLFCLVIAVGMWAVMLLDNADGPGGALGLAIFGAASLICLAAGLGLISGAMANISPLVGLGLGLAVCAICLWLVPHASPLVNAAILMISSIAGCLAPAVRKRMAR